MARDGPNCFWCEVLTIEHGFFGIERRRPNQRTTEHFIPKSAGGSNDDENLVIACMHCNATRGSMSPEEWLEMLDAQGRERAEKMT